LQTTRHRQVITALGRNASFSIPLGTSIFVGQLNERELQIFERAIESGEAYRSYENGAGFLGLAVVRLRKPPCLR
jgi:hypothetical protein